MRQWTKQQTPAQQKNNKTQQAPSPTATQEPAKQQQRQPENASGIPPWTDAFWSNWALVGITGIAAGIALGTLDDLKEQTAATKAFAEAAKKSAEIAEVSLKLVERADVLLVAALFRHGQVLTARDAHIVLIFKNFGRTKAAEVRLSLNLKIEGIPEFDCSDVPPVSMGVGDSQEITSQTFVKFISEEAAQKIFAGKLALVFEGAACYKDVFGQPHRSYYTGTLNSGTSVFRIDNSESD